MLKNLRSKLLSSLPLVLILLSFTNSQAATQAGIWDRVFEALDKHPDIAVINNATSLSKIEERRTLVANLPRVSVSKNWFGENPDDLNQTTTGLNGDINLFRGGQNLFNYFASSSSYEKASIDNWQRINKIYRDVSNLIFKCHFENERLNWSLKTLDLRKSLVTVAKKRFRRGTLPESEVIKLEIDLQNTESQMQSLKLRAQNCQDELSYWMNRDELNLKPDLKVITRILESNQLKGDIEEHPLVMASQSQLDQSEFKNYSQWGSWLPELNLNYQESPQFAGQVYNRQWLLSLRWTIFNSGQRFLNQQKSSVELENARLQLMSTKKRVETDLNKSLQSLKDASVQFNISKTRTKNARKLSQSSIQRFRLGAISANEITLDQNRYIQANFQKIDDQESLIRLWINFNFSNGRSLKTVLKNTKK